MKKPPKKSKYHNRKMPNKWNKMFPKNVLNFPQHLPFNLLSGESSISNTNPHKDTAAMMHHHHKIINNNNDNDDDDDNEPSSAVVISVAPPPPPSSTSISLSSEPTNVYIPENIFNGNTVDYATDDVSNNGGRHASDIVDDALRTITARPIVVYENRQTTDGGAYNRMRTDEKGYFEKTIFNKNGIFIEKIRKIADIDDNTAISSATDRSTATANNENYAGNDGSSSNDNELETINRKRIELMNVPLSQHYVITSSGKIEKTDTLASSDVIEQFRDGLNDFQQMSQQTTSQAANATTLTAAASAVVANVPTTMSLAIDSNGTVSSSTSPSVIKTNSNMAEVGTNLAASTTINNVNGTSAADAGKQEQNCLVMGE